MTFEEAYELVQNYRGCEIDLAWAIVGAINKAVDEFEQARDEADKIERAKLDEHRAELERQAEALLKRMNLCQEK